MSFCEQWNTFCFRQGKDNRKKIIKACAMTDYREEFKQLLENTFISTMWDEGRQKKEIKSFMEKVYSIIPDKLFRYRKFDEYTIKSFGDDSISLCKAKCFSDKYDSLIFVDVEKELEVMKDGFIKGMQRVLKSIKLKDPLLRAEKASKLCYYLEHGMTEPDAIERVIKEEYGQYLNEVEQDLKQRETRFRDSERTARIACFTESIQSKFMWDTYAGGYRGFALEYNLKELLINCIQKGSPVYVFPVIYTDERPDLTTDEANLYIITKAHEQGHVKNIGFFKPLVYPNLLFPHKPFLYKDKEEYAHEKEWRVLFYDKNNCEDFVEIPDEGCLKAIYYGMDIEQDDYNTLHQIALKKGIEEYRVVIDDNSRKYKLKVIPIKSQQIDF